jgi:hypothetical protein
MLFGVGALALNWWHNWIHALRNSLKAKKSHSHVESMGCSDMSPLEIITDALIGLWIWAGYEEAARGYFLF